MVTPEGVVELRPTTRMSQRQHSMDMKCESRVFVEACKARAGVNRAGTLDLRQAMRMLLVAPEQVQAFSPAVNNARHGACITMHLCQPNPPCESFEVHGYE